MEPSPKPSPSPRPSTHRPCGKNELILVADDEEAIRIVSRRTLEAYGYRVVVAADGVSALQILESRGHEVAAFITDMSMPGMDGHATMDAAARLKPDLKIIAMSGYSMKDQPGGADLPPHVRGIIEKPYTPETLLRTLREVLDGKRPGTDANG